MSQVNAFDKAKNPDFVYLDLQQSNVYNNTNGQEVDVNFIETRDSPVVANTGEYHMSVTRFQIDTYKLPTLIVEPDLTIPVDVNRTVHKVAILTESATQVNSAASHPFLTTEAETIFNNSYGGARWGDSIGWASDAEIVAIGAQLTNAGGFSQTGGVWIAQTIPPYLGKRGEIQFYLDYPQPLANTQLGQAVTMSTNGTYVAAFQGQVASGTNAQETAVLVWKRTGIQGLNYTHIGKFKSGLSTRETHNGFPITSVSNTNCMCMTTLSDVNYIFYSIRSTTQGTTQQTRSRVNILKINADDTLQIAANPIELYKADPSGTNPGCSIACSYNGFEVVIGDDASNADSFTGWPGNVLIYRFNGATLNWGLEFNYKGSSNNAPGGGAYTTDNLGFSMAMSRDEKVVVAGAPSANSSIGRVAIFLKTNNNWAFQQNITGLVASQQFGFSVALNGDGTVLTVGCGAGTIDAYVFERSAPSLTFNGTTPLWRTESNATPQAECIFMNSAGNKFLISDGELSNNVGKVAIQELILPNHYVDYLPSALKNKASVVNVKWIPAPDASIPDLNTFTGKNTVEYPYYWCNSYDYFCGLVNSALEEASAANYNFLWLNFWSTVVTAAEFRKGIFFDAAYKSFPTPPFLDWEADTLKASMYVNHCYNRFLAPNYAVPSITWTGVSGDVGTCAVPPPFAFRVALNPSLYALFSSFPATETMLTTTTGSVEKFYVLDINSSGFPIVTPSPTIQRTLYNLYTFNDLIYNTTSFEYTLLGTQPVTAYAYANQFIKVNQELSTIDIWCPINGIVFTTNTLPIVINQFGSNSVINTERPSFETGSQFAMIITDLQTNEQGYKPNLLYNPTAEYRRIDMTGNMGLTNIDIRVFWRAKTGQLIPFKLSSGLSASIKLLFQKKILGEKQQLQLAQTIKELESDL